MTSTGAHDQAVGTTGYSVANAERFGWSSIGDDLEPGRRAFLDEEVRGDRVLDAGCAGGGYVRYLNAKGLVAFGVDREAQFLDLAGELPRLARGDLLALPFADDSFDTTMCFDVLEHVDDSLALAELARVTRRRLLLAVPHTDELFQPYGLTYLHYQDPTHLRTYTVESWAQELHAVLPGARVRVSTELQVPLRPLVTALFHRGAAQQESRAARFFWGKVGPRLMPRLPLPEMHTGAVAVVDLP